MSQKKIKVKVFRFDPSVGHEPFYNTYEVPLNSRMSVLDILDYIYENLDGSLAYYNHSACHSGICGRCMLIVNGKASLACQTMVTTNITVEPPQKFKIIRDLVWTNGGK
jgi:succinate dehydrogenase/fumarate reductase iron-sulfur protein